MYIASHVSLELTDEAALQRKLAQTTALNSLLIGIFCVRDPVSAQPGSPVAYPELSYAALSR